MTSTKIEWTNSTWNPIRARDMQTGKVGHYCEKISSGCANCYSSAMQPRMFGLPQFPGEGKRRSLPMVDNRVPVGDNLEVFLDEKVLTFPLRWKKPRRIFVCSMTDSFGSWVPDEWLDRIFAVVALAHQHTFQVLTKRPERMLAYLQNRAKSVRYWQAAARTVGHTLQFECEGETFGLCRFPLPNCWCGVSVENQAVADERIPLLLQTPAAVRFLSVEPLLGPVELRRHWYTTHNWHDWLTGKTGLGRTEENFCSHKQTGRKIDWVIVGGESGPKARSCDLAWMRSIVEQCRAANVPCFVKQLGRRPYIDRSPEPAASIACKHGVGPLVAEFLQLRDPKGGDISEFPEDLRVREFPQVPSAAGGAD